MRSILVALVLGLALVPPPVGAARAAEPAVHDFRVRGMTCALCARAIEKALRRVEGVEEVAVDRDAERVRVVADSALPAEVLEAAIEGAGAYEAEPVDGPSRDEAPR